MSRAQNSRIGRVSGNEILFFWGFRLCLKYSLTSYDFYEPHHAKMCLRRFSTRWGSDRPARLHKLARVLKLCIEQVAYCTIYEANNKGADQTAQMRRLICTFVVRIWHKTHFRMSWPIYYGKISVHILWATERKGSHKSRGTLVGKKNLGVVFYHVSVLIFLLS